MNGIGHVADISSASLNFVKRAEPELTTALSAGLIRAMANERSTESIGRRLKATREALGRNQTDFAEGAGIAKNTYNQWEKGAERPGLSYALKLCDAYGLTLDWIYRGDKSRLPYDLASKIAA